MESKQPKLDTHAGQRPAKRHRVRGLLLTLILLAVAATCAMTIIGVVRAATEKQPVEQAQDTPEAPAPVVSDAAAPTQENTESDQQSKEDAEADAQAADEEKPKPEEPAEPIEPVEAHLMMIGDVLMHDRVIESGYLDDGSLNYDHLFAHILDDVAEADVAVLNQETILGGTAWPYTGYPNFNGPQEVGDAEVEAGFDVVLKATNHTFDYGYDGIRTELAYWASSHPDMKVIGVADPDGDGVAPAGGTSPAGAYIFEKGALRVALLNYTNVLNGNVDPDNDGRVIALMTEEGIRADVAAAREKEKADLVVVFAHWGEEYETTPVESERYWTGVMQDAGVDVVIGGHPHVIQPVEVLGEGDHKMLVCWSVGNFVSTQVGASNMVGGMVKLTLAKDDTGARVSAYEFVPTITHRVPSSRAMSAYKLSDYTDDLAAENTVWQIDEGRGSSVGWYIDYCAEVLGEAFDYDTLSVHGEL